MYDAAREGAAEAIPVPHHVLRHEAWSSDDTGVALLGWSNEPEHELLPALLRAADGRRLGYCGYLGDPDGDEPRLLRADGLGGVAETLGGVFSIFRADAAGIEAATAIARVCPVYYAETRDLYVVGTRALLVHLTARSAETGAVRPAVDLDVLGLQPMVRHGFYTNDETPFRGVRALPAAASLTARQDAALQITAGPLPEAEPAPAGVRQARERVNRLAEALVAAARPLARHGDPVRLALSGGRDSRIMAAVLTAARVPLTATTHGFADDPDVVLAGRIAGRLGIEHRIDLTVPKAREAAVTVGHPLTRAYDVVRMCEGMTSAYERVNRWAPYEVVPKTSGSGGETLRGGFLYDQKDLSDQGIAKRVRSIFLSAEAFVTPEGNARAAAHHAPWAERARSDGFAVLDQLYLLYRTGRWIVGAHTATLMNSPYYHPFFDNRVVREALALPAEWRSSEEVGYRLIETLAPGLASIPPEGKRWRFERDRPRRITDWPGWRRRAAVVPAGRTAGFNWRKSYDEEFLKLLRDQVMSSPRELFDVVDEAKAKELLSEVPKAWSNQVWHIYTLSVLLSGIWRESRPELPGVRIPLP
ncbi:asparagine synthase-related protein [Spirillospora sp. NPDC127200]